MKKTSNSHPLMYILLLPCIVISTILNGQVPNDNLQVEFRNPPDDARPRTWWHWTGGNVTKEGITKDLEWMKRSGIAGFQLADVAFGAGQRIEEPKLFGTPEWKSAVRYSASEAEQLGLEMGIFSSAGWSLTGGPWVKPEQAMKKLVWSKKTVEGPGHFTGTLPSPPSNNGPIRNMDRSTRPDPESNPTYYGDQVVIAFPTPSDETDRLAPSDGMVSSNAGELDGGALFDDDLNSTLKIQPDTVGGPAWILFDYHDPVTVRSFSIASRQGIPVGKLSASKDGEEYRTLLYLPGAQNYRSGKVRTYSIPETTARYFRLELTGAAPSPAEVISQDPTRVPEAYILSECILRSGSRVHRWEDKAGFSFMFEYAACATPPASETSVIDPDEVVDLTGKMDGNGELNWDVPEGNWTVLRMGYSLTGAKNRPPVATGLGYEVDKLNEDDTRAYMETYLDMLGDSLGDLLGKSLRYLVMDSWEAGMQNWTNDMTAEFSGRRGYDPLPYLPSLAGYIVGSAETSERFLWDFRRTLVDMFAENHYGTITGIAHEHGMGTYSEASGISLEAMEDALLDKKNVDIPMGEFWVHDLHPSIMYYVDVRGAASAAHVYGKPIVAAEAFTGGNYESPFTLKRIGDYWFTQGINRFVFHTSAHQPLETKPGNVMVGTHLHRNITWAEQARPLMDYLARTSLMLLQGHFVADLVYLLDEGAPSTMPFWDGGLKPAPPEGFDYDFINADALLTRMNVDKYGNLVVPGGTSYRILVLPRTGQMTLPVLRKIRDLVRGGATVLGPRVTASPGLSGYPGTEAEVLEISQELWGDLDGVSRTVRSMGNGLVSWGEPLPGLLERIGAIPDISYDRDLDASWSWIHRNSGDTDIYFISNRTEKTRDANFRFRVSDKNAECWDPADGSIKPLSYKFRNGMTTIPLHFSAYGSAVVVFRNQAGKDSRLVAEPAKETLAELEGPWNLVFQPGPGNPGSTRLDNLVSWTLLPDSAMKYFSGSARYSKTFEVPDNWIQSDRSIMLDLGEVRDLAEVRLNGTILPLLWKEPFRTDVSSSIRKGLNSLEITVTNEWTNRLAGDEHLPENQRTLDAFIRRFGGRYHLQRSGLLGPVRIVAKEKSRGQDQ